MQNTKAFNEALFHIAWRIMDSMHRLPGIWIIFLWSDCTPFIRLSIRATELGCNFAVADNDIVNQQAEEFVALGCKMCAR